MNDEQISPAATLTGIASDPAFARKHYLDAVAMFWDAVDAGGDRTAMIAGSRTLSYTDYGRAVSALAQRLAEAGAMGERVAVLIPNSLEANVAIFATLAAGGQVVLLNSSYSVAELSPMLASAAPRIVIVLEGSDDTAVAAARAGNIPEIITFGAQAVTLEALVAADTPWPRVEIDPDSLATLLFTGGTTGQPKGVDRTHRTLVETVAGMHSAWPTKLGDEMWLNVAPVSHIWGSLMGCMNPVYGHCPVVIVPRFRPDLVLDALVTNRVTVFSGGPAAIYVGLLAAPDFPEADLGALRVCPGGGSPFLLETLKSWQQATQVPILEAFGMTEAGPITANPVDGSHRFGTVGRALPGIEVQIVSLDDPERQMPTGETGEIRIRGSRVINRYRGEPSGHPEGWLYTGDVGLLDEIGFLRLVDRKKDMLIVGGFNVYPREIEEVLARHPAVAEAGVVGIADERKGEVPIAFATLRSGAGATAEEIAQYCAERLVAYKQPNRMILLEAIPKTQANKICRKTLASLARVAAEGDSAR